MELFVSFLGKCLGWCFSVTGDYLWAVIFFTLLTKIVLLPVNLIVQANGIKMVKITPELNMIKCDFYGDNEKISEETMKLYKREKYNPFISLVPLVLQLILLMGVIECVKSPDYSGIAVSQMLSAGLDFSLIPSQKMGIYIIFPLIAALSALLMCACQNKSQVLQAEQSNANKYGMAAFSTLLSLYLGFFVTAGVAAYWTFSNIFSTLQIYLLNAMMDPRKSIDYEALEKSRKRLETFKAPEKNLTPEQRRRQKADYKRFFSIDNKHIVFYSEKSGFYKYYSRLIEYLTSHSNIKIHYVTSDPDDVIFEKAKTNKSILPYFIGETRLISLFMKMDSQIVVMTTPDLENFHIKRSYVKKDIEYIYLDHGISSLNMLLRKGAVDHFDTIFCAGPPIKEEMLAQEKTYGLKPRNLVEYGYGLIDDLAEIQSRNDVPAENYILLAPSHQKDNILDSCLDEMVEGLLRAAPVIIRPHPQYVKRFPDKWNAIVQKYSGMENVTVQEDFSSNDTIYKAALVVTDWSNIVYEYCFSVLRPVLFVNTPMKIINPDYNEIGVEPVDISLRSKIGKAVSGKDPDETAAAAKALIESPDFSREKLAEARSEVLYNFMNSAEVGGKYILSSLKNKKEQK